MMLAVGEHVLGEMTHNCVRLTTGLAGGLGGTKHETCGALTGGVLVIGGLHGRDELQDDDQIAYDLSNRFREGFLGEFGSTQCQPVHDQVHAPDGSGSCSVVAERAALILLQLLSER